MYHFTSFFGQLIQGFNKSTISKIQRKHFRQEKKNIHILYTKPEINQK